MADAIDDGLIKALTKCRDKFREYEELHMAKIKPEFGASLAIAAENAEENALARSKAERNREMADLCDEALSRHKATLSVSKEAGNG